MIRALLILTYAALRTLFAAAVTTTKGKEIGTGRMIGSSPTQAEPKNISWGYNPSSLTAASTDVSLFQEGAVARTVGTSSQVTTTTTNDTYQVTGTITATGSRTVAEVALFDSATQPAQATVTTGATSVVGSSSNTNLYSTANFNPGQNNFVQIRTEVLKITDANGNSTLHTVTRAQNGSTAISTIAASDPIEQGNPPGQTGVTGGSGFLHADHSSDGLATNDSIAYTIKWQLT